MNLKEHLFLFFILFVFLSCKNKNDNVCEKQINNNVLEDSAQYVDIQEYVSFWKKFSNALALSDSTLLSPLIIDNFNGYCSPNLDISSICNINFDIDSTISKSRFIKEFYFNLNPVFVELLKKYEVNKDVIFDKTLNDSLNSYQCKMIDGERIYYIGTSFKKGFRNKCFTFMFCSKIDEYSYVTKTVRLFFCKYNNQIKLFNIDCYYFDIDE
jgi:hypothetical protein